MRLTGIAILLLTNPAPLLIGEQRDPVPLADIVLVINYRTDIGAFEHRPEPRPMRLGDLSLNHRITPYDFYLFELCWDGPAEPIRTHLTRTADQASVPVACWLADLNADRHVDLRDFSLFQPVIEDAFAWGDVDRDGVVGETDVDIVRSCLDLGPETAGCEHADLNESLWVNGNDLELVLQATSP